MKSRIALASLLWCSLATVAGAQLIIDPGTHNLVENIAGQRIPIMVSDNVLAERFQRDPVTGATLFDAGTGQPLKVIDPGTGQPALLPRLFEDVTINLSTSGGGPNFGGTIGPMVTGLDVDVNDPVFGQTNYQGHSFGPNGSNTTTLFAGNQLISHDISTNIPAETSPPQGIFDGGAEANGLLGMATIDTTGIPRGFYDLNATSAIGSLNGPTVFGTVVAQGSPGMLTVTYLSDINGTGDLLVNSTDLGILLNNWGTGTTRAQGNLANTVASPFVDSTDLGILLNQWTGNTPAPAMDAVLADAGLAAVPEPSTVILGAMGLLSLIALAWRKRRRAA